MSASHGYNEDVDGFEGRLVPNTQCDYKLDRWITQWLIINN